MQPGSKLNFDIDDFLKLMKTMKAMKIKKWNQHEVDIDLKEEWLEKLNSIPNVKLINICSGHEVESITALGGDNYPGIVFRLVSDNKNIDKFKDKSLEINDQLNKLKETWAEVSWFIYSGKIINQDLSKSRYYKCFIGKTELPDNVIINGRGDIINGSVQIRVFPDRIEVISPGRLPRGVTLKNIGEMSSRRNEIIADMFARLNVVEKAGTGIIRIREAMKVEGLQPPVFEDKEDFFKIILYRPPGVKEIAEAPQKVPRKSTQKKYPEKVPRKSTLKIGGSAQKVLKLIAADQNITTSEMAIKIGVSPDAVKKHLAKLKMKNLIIRVGPDKGGHWEIVK